MPRQTTYERKEEENKGGGGLGDRGDLRGADLEGVIYSWEVGWPKRENQRAPLCTATIVGELDDKRQKTANNYQTNRGALFLGTGPDMPKIILYDIASRLSPQAWSPNVWKAR